MRKNKRTLPLFLVLCLFVLIFRIGEVDATERTRLETLAVSLVIDVSGSMERTDPEMLREVAADIFIDLLSPEDYLGVITFDHEVQEVVPMQNIASAQNKRAIKAQLDGNLAPAGDTDYIVALEEAVRQLDGLPGDTRKIILFLTDGIPDPNPAIRLSEEGPAFMEAYMEDLWTLVGDIGQKRIPIYSVGFGEISPEILERISLETLGEATIAEDSSELAEVFFGVVEALKNRNPLINESFTLSDARSIPFEIDSYISQTTLVVTHDRTNFDLNVVPPSEGVPGEGITLIEDEGYTLLTINQTQEEYIGTWRLDLIPRDETDAEGDPLPAPQMKILGSTDFFFKIWLEEPLDNVLHPIREPIDIRVYSSGELPQGASMEAIIIKNGTRERNPIFLTRDGDYYVGRYDATNEHGNYEVEIRLRDGGDTIATAKSRVTVKNIPTITTDYFADSADVTLGSSRIFRSSIVSGGTNLTPSSILSLEYFNLVLEYEDGTLLEFPLRDDGQEESGDLSANDGIFSTRVLFEQEGIAQMYLSVRGEFRDELFILQRNLGTVNVGEFSEIQVIPPRGGGEVRAGNPISIPITIKNPTIFSETLTFRVKDDSGTIANPAQRIAPGEERTVLLEFLPAEDRTNETFFASIGITASSEERTVQPDGFLYEVTVYNWMGAVERWTSQNQGWLQPVAAVVLGGLLLFLVLGILLYNAMVGPLFHITGILHYKKAGRNGDFLSHLELGALKMNKIVIGFGKHQGDAQYLIEGTPYEYQMIFEKVAERTSNRVMEGYKALLKRNEPPRLRVRTTEPGIMNFDGAIGTRRFLMDGSQFESGDILFKYEENDVREKGKVKKQIGAKNLLEDKGT